MVPYTAYKNGVIKKLKNYLKDKGYSDSFLKEEYTYKKDDFKIKVDFAIIYGDELIEVYEIINDSDRKKTKKEDSLFYKNKGKYLESTTALFVSLDNNDHLQFKTITTAFEAFSSFYRALIKYFKPEDTKYQYFFRGHSSTDFNFLPSIYRENDTTKGINDEDKIFKEAVRKNPSDFPDNMSTFEHLVKMQHYELPTRLLDITTNPLVALYFACCDHDENDGEILIFKILKEEIRYFDSDSVRIVANIARRPKGFTIPKKENFKDSDEEKELLSEIRIEKPGFVDRMEYKHLESVFCVLPKLDNPRIASQSGAFLIFGIDKKKTSPAKLKFAPSRIIIGSKGKKKILKELVSLGIDRATLFPEIDKILQEIKKK